ncbi:MAG: hypothetical protein EXQ48_08125 [Acidobacteria bacterium]|nr:hypothetical protein [Acidobacteriota bacterium]
MKTAAGGFVLAILLFVLSALGWSEAGLAGRMADAHERMATLRYDAGGVDRPRSAVGRLTESSLDTDADRYNVDLQYWRKQYGQLVPMTTATGTERIRDARRLFVAANAAFRQSEPGKGAPKDAISRLDGVLLAYADVLRADPSFADAAFNYEYVARLRDTLSRGKPLPQAPPIPEDDPERRNIELPNGPTPHGSPGESPNREEALKVKVITPLRSDEREEAQQAGSGSKPRRKG